jgi:hypothetical protein
MLILTKGVYNLRLSKLRLNNNGILRREINFSAFILGNIEHYIVNLLYYLGVLLTVIIVLCCLVTILLHQCY